MALTHLAMELLIVEKGAGKERERENSSDVINFITEDIARSRLLTWPLAADPLVYRTESHEHFAQNGTSF